LKAKITLVVCFCLVAVAQDSVVPQWPPRETKPSDRDQEMTERRKKEFNLQRHKAIVADAAKIVGLAGEIKQGVQSDEPASSAALVGKLESVEKLAHRIKNKMQENANISDASRPSPARGAMNKTTRPPASPSGL
jgi:hypothetical protein